MSTDNQKDPFANTSPQDEPDFFSEVSSEEENNPFQNFGDSSESAFGDLPMGDGEEGIGSPFDDLPTDETSEESPEVRTEVAGKGKKAKKKEKAPKVKKPKIKRVKPKNVPWAPGDVLIVICATLAALLIIAGDVLAFLWYQTASLTFIASFSMLGLILLLVPFLLWRRRVWGERVTLFDTMLALSLAFIILGSMILLLVQSLKYGKNIQPSWSNVDASAQSLK